MLDKLKIRVKLKLTYVKYVKLRKYVTLVTTYVVRLTLGTLAFVLLVTFGLSWCAYSFGRLIFRMLECGIRNIRRQLSRLGVRP